MNEAEEQNQRLSPEDAALVARIAETLQPPPESAAQRVAFNAALERRLARRTWRPGARTLAGVATAAAALILALTFTGRPGPTRPEVGTAAIARTATPAEAMLSMLGDGLPSEDQELPEDYRAISELFLAGS